MKRRVVLVMAAFAMWSCSKQAEAVVEHRYQIAGVVVRLDPRLRQAVIKHQAIRDAAGKVWMEAMTMEFPVRDAREFASLEVGQRIRATVHQTEPDYEYWISGIHLEPGKQETK